LDAEPDGIWAICWVVDKTGRGRSWWRAIEYECLQLNRIL
jgi:hypothetical protein